MSVLCNRNVILSHLEVFIVEFIMLYDFVQQQMVEHEQHCWRQVV